MILKEGQIPIYNMLILNLYKEVIAWFFFNNFIKY